VAKLLDSLGDAGNKYGDLNHRIWLEATVTSSLHSSAILHEMWDFHDGVNPIPIVVPLLTPHGIDRRYRRFERTYCLHLVGALVSNNTASTTAITATTSSNSSNISTSDIYSKEGCRLILNVGP
jgi:hypothetical protein